MAKRITFRFLRRWQDLDWVFSAGDEITLSSKEVETARKRMKKWGNTADLCRYGLNLIPLSFLEEVKVVKSRSIGDESRHSS